MATFFKNKVINSVGTLPVEVISTSGAQRATVIGLSLTNLKTDFVYVNIYVQDDTSVTGYYLKDTVLPANTSLRAVSTGEKLIIAPTNKLLISSNQDDSVDVICSYVEIT